MLLAPLLVYTAFGIFWVVQLGRQGLTNRTALGGAILAMALATLPQAYLPPLVVRFLQSATPCYLLAIWLVAELVRVAGTRTAAWAGGVAATAAGAAAVWLAVSGVPRIEPWQDYAGSWRLHRNSVPVDVLGDEIFTSFQTAEEIRLIRAFLGDRAPEGEPIFAWPWLSLHYLLLERPNPTRAVFERIRSGNFSMTSGMKRAEMERLLGSISLPPGLRSNSAGACAGRGTRRCCSTGRVCTSRAGTSDRWWRSSRVSSSWAARRARAPRCWTAWNF